MHGESDGASSLVNCLNKTKLQDHYSWKGEATIILTFILILSTVNITKENSPGIQKCEIWPFLIRDHLRAHIAGGVALYQYCQSHPSLEAAEDLLFAPHSGRLRWKERHNHSFIIANWGESGLTRWVGMLGLNRKRHFVGVTLPAQTLCAYSPRQSRYSPVNGIAVTKHTVFH